MEDSKTKSISEIKHTYFAFWKRLRKNKKVIINTGMLLAIQVVVGLISVPMPPPFNLFGLQLNFTAIILVIGLMMVGPFWASIVAVVAPFISAIFISWGAFALVGSPILAIANISFIWIFIAISWPIYLRNWTITAQVRSWVGKSILSMLITTVLVSIFMTTFNYFVIFPLFEIPLFTPEANSYIWIFLSFNLIQFGFVWIIYCIFSIPVQRIAKHSISRHLEVANTY